jgi:CBS domain-containing protein
MRNLVARDVMNPEILAVRDDSSVTELAEFLTDNEISGAPVEDAQGRLVGVVSLTDLAAAVSGQREEAPPAERPGPSSYLKSWDDRFNPEDLAGLRVGAVEATVGEIMTPSIFAVDEETPISKVAERMIHSHVHRLLVTRDQKVVGIVTTSDLLGLLVEAYEPGP